MTIDLRSDTITRPTPAMRRAMAEAEVGDDQYGEDPTVNRLQELFAERLGKEAALFCASGTLANQIALKLLTRPGDDVIVARESHAVWHETGASAANNGVQFTEVGTGGLFTADDVRAACKPRGHIVYPPTALVEIENTHNRGGGRVFPQVDVVAICATARELGLATYLDGARLFNAAAASSVPARVLAEPFDLVAVALSKGLGAPIGTMLAGRARDIGRAVRYRRMLGGALRQAGIVAAAGIYALQHHVERLAEDNDNARLIAERIADSPRVRLDLDTVETNILVWHLDDSGPDAFEVVARAKALGVLIMAFGPRMLRAVTHLDVDRESCARAADLLVEAMG